MFFNNFLTFSIDSMLDYQFEAKVLINKLY